MIDVQEDAKAYGAEMYRTYGAGVAQQIADALFGFGDDREVREVVADIRRKFPENWGYVAGALDPDCRHENGEVIHQC